MSVINYNYASMQAAIEDSNKACQNMQQVCDDIDTGYANLATVYVGETKNALLAKNHQASQRRQELLAQFKQLNQHAIEKMEQTQHLDHQGANALLG